jgi:hypothetical protein
MRDHIGILANQIAVTLDDTSVSVHTRCMAAFQQFLSQSITFHVDKYGRMPDGKDDIERAGSELLQLMAARMREV